MKQIEILEAASFLDVINCIELVRKTRPEREIWYRGHSSQSYFLSPGLHRGQLDSATIAEKEIKLYKEFNFRSPMFDSFIRTDVWDQLFLMQHYRLPTRLLDWTSSPLVGLFFALSTYDNKKSNKGPTLWVLDPAR